MKQLMTGNEAFALGAYMSGIKIGAGAPLRPDSPIHRHRERRLSRHCLRVLPCFARDVRTEVFSMLCRGSERWLSGT